MPQELYTPMKINLKVTIPDFWALLKQKSFMKFVKILHLAA